MKNEAAILPRMLASVEPVIVGGAVTDTGSTDDSVAIVEEFFRAHHKPLHIHHAPFHDFSQARNTALRRARAIRDLDYDYILFIDCDYELVTGGVTRLDLDAPTYSILQSNGKISYWNVRLLRRDLDLWYRGPTHEYIHNPAETSTALRGWWYRDHGDGASRADKYERDIRMLNAALTEDPDNARNIFYLIQSYFGAGKLPDALVACQRRLQLEGHPEERFWAAFHRADIARVLGAAPADYLAGYLQAYEMRPWRAEPLVELAALHRQVGSPHTALLYAREAARLPFPTTEVLSVVPEYYEWRALDEWLVNAGATGNAEEALAAAQRLCKCTTIPDAQRGRIEENLRETSRQLLLNNTNTTGDVK